MLKILCLIFIYLFAFSYEKKTESNCNAEYFGCNFKCGLVNDKNDSYGLYVCMTDCDKQRKKCLKSIKK